ncbi:hypothetical protein [Kocuria rosea]|uniref:hypothetical protein n=1 Tax=Kocuria rosea TaxID=1275 RepID=UPI000E0E7BF3|nr:hypothetical protein [Kocuria rosea]
MLDELCTEGLMRHPATEEVAALDVRMRMHGHDFQVLTVDQAGDPQPVPKRLLSVVMTWTPSSNLPVSSSPARIRRTSQ